MLLTDGIVPQQLSKAEANFPTISSFGFCFVILGKVDNNANKKTAVMVSSTHYCRWFARIV